MSDHYCSINNNIAVGGSLLYLFIRADETQISAVFYKLSVMCYILFQLFLF